MTPDFWLGLAIGSICGGTIGLFFGCCLGAGAIADRENVIRAQQVHIDALADALHDEGKRDKYRDIEREVEEMEDAIPWERIGVVTPERRGR